MGEVGERRPCACIVRCSRVMQGLVLTVEVGVMDPVLSFLLLEFSIP